MEKKSNQDQIKEITAQLEKGIQELFESEKYRNYLTTMSRFHNYSFRNTMLIYLQRPDAAMVAGFNHWEKSFGRHVKKGEKGIKIFAPTPYMKKIQEQKIDPDTHLPVLDPEGKPVTEEKSVKMPGFKVVSVFDVSQTYGKPIPQLASQLTGNVENYEVFMEALRRTSPVPLEITSVEPGMDGYFDVDDQSIAIREGMSEMQTVSTAIHEISHAKLHNPPEEPPGITTYEEIQILGKPGLFSNGRIPDDEIADGFYRYEIRGSDDDPGDPATVERYVGINHAGTILTMEPLDIPEKGSLDLTEDSGLNFMGGDLSIAQFQNIHRKSRATEEVEAESISYAVCQYFGIDTGENSFGYIAEWSSGKELNELKASLETINKTASELIGSINNHFREICQERGISLTKDAELPLEAPTEQEPPAESPSTQKKIITSDDLSVSSDPNTRYYDNTMPDPLVSQDFMREYGYKDMDILPMSQDRARELLPHDVTLYMLYPTGTEEMVLDKWDVEHHDALFGISQDDWDSIKDKVPHRDVEQRFLNCEHDTFAIYQLRPEAPAELAGASFGTLAQPPNRENYQAVYVQGLNPGDDVQTNLYNIADIFTGDTPWDFTGHKNETGDIIALKRDGVVTYHYCDYHSDDCFKELHNFQKPENHLRAVEMSTEDDYGMIDGIINNGKQPTVAELEQQAKSGTPISLMDLAAAVHREKKQSVLEQLKPTAKKPKTKGQHKKKSEKEI